MQDPNLHERKRIRRKKRKKAKKRVFLFRRILLLAIILAAGYFLGKFTFKKISELNIANKDFASQEEDEKIKFSLEEEQEKPKGKKEKVDPNISFEDMKKDLDNRIDTFLKGEKISKENFSLGFFNLQTDESYGFNEKKDFSIGWANNFIVAMDVYDLALEKNIDLDQELDLPDLDGDKAKLSKKFTPRELIKLMISRGDQEARQGLIDFVEEKSSKNWYDELSMRYGVDLSYTNKINGQDALKVLRRLFAERRMTLEERLKAEDDTNTVLVYQELINFMSENVSTSPLIASMSKRGQVGESYGVQYEDKALMGFVLTDKQYIYVVMSTNTKQARLYEGLNILEQWQDYYYK
ncbi:MAG: serine hydrolase [Tissierellia bacterium]|nr:serine hydrolase [Tissierellia bacterium]